MATYSSAQSLDLTNYPSHLSVRTGEVAVFIASSTNLSPITYSWFKDGVALKNSDRISGANSAQLSVCPVVPGDAGQYTVAATDGTNAASGSPMRLVVDVTTPVFTNGPAGLHLASGETAQFSAGASGTPPISYWWQRDGTNISDTGRITGARTSTLTISTVTAEDSGWYSLTASNADGRVSSEPARLYVNASSALAQAAGFDAGVWTTGGNASWSGQSAIARDGNALSHGAIGDNESTYVETTVYGPGDLRFYWKISAEGPDRLDLLVNGILWDRISGEVDWTERQFHLGSGPHVLRWQYQKDGSIARGLDRAFVDQVAFTPTPLVSLEKALNAPPLPLATLGHDRWFGQTTTSHDGTAAARSGYLLDNQFSAVETTVSGPGWISFNWKVSSEGADPFQFLVDGVQWAVISGEVEWTNQTFHIPWGQRTLTWRYRKDGSVAKGADAAWLDQVSYTAVGLYDLAQASDWFGTPWSSGGHGRWFGQNEYTDDGSDAVQSSPIGHSQTAFLDTTVTGPGTLVYTWKVSSEGADPLRFLVNSNEWARISGNVDWTVVTNVIRPGANLLRWQYSKDYSVSVGADAGWVDKVNFVAAPPVPEAANGPSLSWTVSGDAPWFAEMVTTHDGQASVRCGDIGHNQSSLLQTTVSGPGSGSFFWKTSSEANCDCLLFLIDGTEIARISGETDWAQHTFSVSTGVHTLAWRYQKDGSAVRGQDAAWIDEFDFAGSGLRIASPLISAGAFTVTVPTSAGRGYVLEYKNSLQDAAWTPLPLVMGTGAPLMLTDSAATNAQRFYRVRVE